MCVFLQVWLALEILAFGLQANLDAELGNAKPLLFNKVNFWFCLVNDKYDIDVAYTHSEAFPVHNYTSLEKGALGVGVGLTNALMLMYQPLRCKLFFKEDRMQCRCIPKNKCPSMAMYMSPRVYWLSTMYKSPCSKITLYFFNSQCVSSVQEDFMIVKSLVRIFRKKYISHGRARF